jgi:hypothetical protein
LHSLQNNNQAITRTDVMRLLHNYEWKLHRSISINQAATTAAIHSSD